MIHDLLIAYFTNDWCYEQMGAKKLFCYSALLLKCRGWMHLGSVKNCKSN